MESLLLQCLSLAHNQNWKFILMELEDINNTIAYSAGFFSLVFNDTDEYENYPFLMRTVLYVEAKTPVDAMQKLIEQSKTL